MAAREAYIRCTASLGHMECSPGLEMRPGDRITDIARELKVIALTALDNQRNDHERIFMEVEAAMHHRWPDRVYFVETEMDGMGVQVYQPWGMPRGS